MTRTTDDGSPPEGGDENALFSRARATDPNRWGPRAAVLGAVALILVGAWFWSQGNEDRALGAMSPAQRSALFQETRASFQRLCLGDAGTAFAQRCRQQASFLRHFPECDAACQAGLAPFLPQPAR